MPATGAASPWTQDLPVCFDGRPCADYPPFTADVIDLTSALTPASGAIAIGCFAVLVAGLALIAFDLRSQVREPRLRVVAASGLLTLAGAVVAGLARLRLSTIATFFGLEGAGSPDPYGSWVLTQTAGELMACSGVVGLTAAATIAITRLRRLLRAGVSEVEESTRSATTA